VLKTGFPNPHLYSQQSPRAQQQYTRYRGPTLSVLVTNGDRGRFAWMAIPERLQVLAAMRTNFVVGQCFTAGRFFSNDAEEKILTCERRRGHP
jgi:hypothetical protein